jgi:SPP1 gp7 family putative phage head morphogenesis protein
MEPLPLNFWEDEEAVLQSLVIDLIAEAAQAGVTAGLNGLGTVEIVVDYDLLSEAALQYAQQHTFNMVSFITETSRIALQEEFAEWVASGQPLDALIDELRPMFGDVRAEMIASTEITRIFADSNMLAWKETGVVEGRRWQTANDDQVCPICGPLHLETAGLDDSFPGELDNPPAHPRCRCFVQPIVMVNA